MTANILNTELASILQDSKKKNAELRNAAEQSIQDLKAITVTSESQLAADLRRKPRFVSPFLLACKTKTAKTTLSAVSCLQRLVVNKALPNDSLEDVLEAFQESVSVSLDVQLRVLQALPSFLQHYGDALEGELQATVLQTCISLQQIKNVAVSNTASATLQQSVSSLFEKVETEDDSKIKPEPVENIVTDHGTVPVRPAAFDAYRTLKDVCLMTQGQEPQFIRRATLSQNFGLELIETVLLNHADLLNAHEELGDLLQKFVMPLVNQLLSERLGFPLTVRTMRVLCILVREHLEVVNSECEIALGLLNYTLESEATQPWRRALCMEAFRVIYSNAELVVNVYATFDNNPDRGNVIQDNLSLFVRMASEKPALIGLGKQSSVPSAGPTARTATQDSAVAEAGAAAAAGMFGSDFGVSESNVPGISVHLSSMKISCLDQLDKPDGPTLPETYIYSLVLTCINAMSDSLAKVVLPLSMHRSQRKARGTATERDVDVDGTGSDAVASRQQLSRAIPANPLDLKQYPGHSAVVSVAALVANCWPAVLATSSTFFNAALDADFYRSLVRSFQKFTQVAGILRLATPRDALLTTLAKTAVPPSLLGDIMASIPGTPTSKSIKGLLSPSSEGPPQGPDFGPKSRHQSVDVTAISLSQRNLMCLRALVHLAIALGPILEQAWTIVLETIQKANVLMQMSGPAAMAREYRSTAQSGGENAQQPTLASELTAVEGAVNKLMQTTNEYPDEAFKVLLTALCNLLASSHTPDPNSVLPSKPTTPQRRFPSVSGIATAAGIHPQYSHFAIAKLGDLARTNLRRLAAEDRDYGWSLLLEHLQSIIANTHADPKSRQMAADVLASVAAEASISTAGEDYDLRHDVQQRSVDGLKSIIDPLLQVYRVAVTEADLDIHLSALGSLRAILEHCGDALVTGWNEIFDIVNSVFSGQAHATRPLSAKIARSAFASVQLICSDFLDTISESMYPALVDIMMRFCSQTLDMNISLSVVTLFWNVSDHFRAKITRFAIPTSSEATIELSQLKDYASQGSVTASWLLLQQTLAELAHDSRADVRNGSIQILFRTLEGSGDQLTALIWRNLLNSVLLRLLHIDSERQTRLREHEIQIEIAERRSLNQSSGLVIENVAKAFATFLNQLRSMTDFDQIWHSLLELFATYIDCDSYELTENVFTALARILVAAENLSQFTPQAVNEVASLWAREIPKADSSPENNHSSRDRAILAYIRTLKEIHRLWKDNINTKQIIVVIQRLHTCVYAAKSTPYTVDTSKETELQFEVLSCFDMLCVHLQVAHSSLLETLAGFICMPYMDNGASPGPQSLTFVAFAKSAMSILEVIVKKLARVRPMYSEGGFGIALESLALSIEKKYTWAPQGPDPSLWSRATSCSLEILRETLPAISELSLDGTHIEAMWSRTIRIGAAIQSAHYLEQPRDGVLLPDEAFDLNAFATFRNLVTPYLNTATVSNDVRLAYVHSVFQTSVVHVSRHDDTGYFKPSREQSWSKPLLAPLKVERLGRTHDPPFTPRIRIAYAALEELFSMVTAGPDNKEAAAPRLLAPTAFPFVVLRAAIPLKRYIADQPLRGRMPIPTSQRLELLYILRLTAELACLKDIADGKVDESPTVTTSMDKVHLKWLAPLVNQAMELAGRDPELSKAMGRVVGATFGKT